MNERKDLDRLFQEKFKDFEVTPPDFVWENIQEKLQEKKTKRVIPLWYKVSGVAALLVLGGLLTVLFLNDTENPAVNAPAVVIDQNTTTPADALKAAPDTQAVPANPSGTVAVSPDGKTGNGNNINTAVATADEAVPSATGNNTNNNAAIPVTGRGSRNAGTASSVSNTDNAVAHEGNSSRINKKNRKRTRGSQNIQQGEAIVMSAAASQQSAKQAQSAAIVSGNNIAEKIKNNTAKNDNDAVAAARLKNAAKNFANGSESQRNVIDRNANVAERNTEAVAANTNGAEGNASNQDNANAKATQNNTVAATRGNDAANSGNADGRSSAIIDKSIPVSEIAAANTEADTTANKIVAENELEKLLQEKLNGEKDEEKSLAENKPKERWNIKPQVAPVFYNSVTEGSPINEGFTNNAKSYDNDLSYGLGINYALSDRISIRSGINTVNLSFSTNDVAYYASLTSSTTNIATSKLGGSIVVQNPGDDVPDTQLIDGQPAQLTTGSMFQQTGYIEVPMEMSYAVLNKKFGIDIIGGVSTLFLNKNNVSVISESGERATVGRAENLNNVHFSTNLGLGFKYRFWDSFQASFEPTFKYQVNTYSRDAGNFRPYFIGLYTGVSFSF